MRVRLQGSGHGAYLLMEMNRCRLSNSLCDVLLVVGGRSFHAHRVVLACAASYFRGLFSMGSRGITITLDSVAPANFDRVLTFIYTAETFTDLIDVGVLYELAKRLGVRELVQACLTTFPNLRESGSGPGEQVLDGDPALGLAPTPTRALPACSSSAAPSFLSSGYSSAVLNLPSSFIVPPQGGSSFHMPSLYLPPSPTPPPLPQPQPLPQPPQPQPLPQPPQPQPLPQPPQPQPLPQPPKEEDMGLSAEYDRSAARKGPEESPHDGDPFLHPPLQVRAEEMEEERGSMGERETERGTVTGEEPGSMQLSPVEACSLGELRPTTSSFRDPLEGQQMGPVEERSGIEGGYVPLEEDGADEEGGSPVLAGGSGGRVGVIMMAHVMTELSDGAKCIKEEEEDEDEDEDEDEEDNNKDLVSTQSRGWAACEACGEMLPLDAPAVRAHAETHLHETGPCRVCGANFADRAAGVMHVLLHVGILLFSCDMCHLQFCSQAEVVRHRQQAFGGTAQPRLDSAPWVPFRGLCCAVCEKRLPKDFQAVRDHLLAHVCVQSLRCWVCQQTQPSLCTLLWHTLAHLSLLVYSCPHCACSFLERPLLERHVALHAEDAQGGGGQAFRSASAFQRHLSQHASNLRGRPSKRKSDHAWEYSAPFPGEMGGAANLEHPEATASKKVKWLRCRSCGKRFAHLGEFTYHLRIHTGEKPYQCKVCLRFFRGRSTLICHLKTHAGALMYRCTVCGLYFSTFKAVVSHMELHKDSLPPDFNIEQTFMYNDRTKEPANNPDN